MSGPKQPMIPLQGLFCMIVDLAKYNGKPLTFPLEWKNDYLAVFFQTMVEKGCAVWEEEKKEQTCQESSTPSSESTSSSPLILSP